MYSKRAFTIIEIVVSIVVLSGFIGAVMYLYGRSSDSFKITAWKQERTAQADLFWAQARKALEEATNKLSFTPGMLNPTLTEEPRPLKFHPDPNAVPDGNIMAWHVSKTTIDMVAGNHTTVDNTFALARNKRRIALVGGARPVFLDDVVRIEFVVSSVTRMPNNAEEVVAGVVPTAVGTMLEISFTLAPPPGYIAGDLRIPMNHKFRLNVAPFADMAPIY